MGRKIIRAITENNVLNFLNRRLMEKCITMQQIQLDSNKSYLIYLLNLLKINNK